jgi:hypothetical protein
MAMSADERDKKMGEIATAAATAFCRKYENVTMEQIESSSNPTPILEYSIPYLTVRTLHRHERALKSLEADSRWINLDTVAHSLSR